MGMQIEPEGKDRKLTITASKAMKLKLQKLARRDNRSASGQVAHLIDAEFYRVFGTHDAEPSGAAGITAAGTTKETKEILGAIQKRRRVPRRE